MAQELMEYRSKIHMNSEIFLFNFKDEFAAFDLIVGILNKFLSVISTEHMISGKSLVGFIPHLSLIHRQYLNSFQGFSTFQSYQGWVMLRPAIESFLIIGKWLDDKDNFEIWKRHEEDWKSYNRVYSGKNLISKSLQDSDSIQLVLKTLNDRYIHANPSYYSRHSAVQQVDADNYYLWTSYFDDQKEHEVGLYSFLHLTIFMLNGLGKTLQPLFNNKEPFEVDIAKFQKVFGEKARILAHESSENLKELVDLGLWPKQVLEYDLKDVKAP